MRKMNRRLFITCFPVISIFSVFSCACANPIILNEPGMQLDNAESILPWLLFFLLVGVISLIQLVARVLMLQKRTGRGWRIIIPFYGRYLEYKNYWQTKHFWVNLGLSAYMLIAAIGINHTDNDTVSTFLAIPFLIALAIVAVNRIRLRMNTLGLFDFNEYLGLLGIVGLGFITDFLCGFSKRGRKEEKIGSTQVPQEHIDNWE